MAAIAQPRVVEPGTYLTDGRRLIYVLGLQADGRYAIEINSAAGEPQVIDVMASTLAHWKVVSRG